jgi:DNA-binding MarR family transcriptional regulator
MSAAKKQSHPAPKVLTDLLSSRLHTLAGLSAASASLRVERKFGLALLEWRSIGMLGGFAPLSLKELARRAALDKSYASRTVAGLIERGLVVSEKNDADARGVMLSLTKEGQTLYKKVFADAVARNERLLAPLSAEQRTHLMETLATLTVSARRRARLWTMTNPKACKAPHPPKRTGPASTSERCDTSSHASMS